jgi:cytochrome P450
MYPPAMFIPRQCTKPFRLETHSGAWFEVEAGTPVIIPVYALHYDPQYFRDPSTFDPDRFREENKKNRHKYAYLPFGDGPRICLGTYKYTECAVIHWIWGMSAI